MQNDHVISDLEVFFLALADKTRLRILNLMRNGEVSVNHFTTALNVSQPKVSRHLAYLRHAGLVETRRDGKWIYYGIKTPEQANDGKVLDEILEWLSTQPQMAEDYRLLWGNLATPQKNLDPEPYISAKTNISEDATDELEIYLL
jgi:ArsR family transcriptional regulator